MVYSINYTSSALPKPSAPPMDQINFQRNLAYDAAKKVEEKKFALRNFTPNLKDSLNEDCQFCLSPLNEQPEGDFNEGLLLAQAKCGHIFHEFCINSLINSKKAPNKDCPSGRCFERSMTVEDLTLIPVDPELIVKKPVAQQSAVVEPSKAEVIAIEAPIAHPAGPASSLSVTLAPVHPLKPQEPAAKRNESSAAVYLKDVAVKAVWGAYSFIRNEKIEATNLRNHKTEGNLSSLESAWKEMPDSCKTDRDNVMQLVASIRLWLANSPADRTTAIKRSKEAEKQADNIWEYTSAFKTQRETSEKAYKEAIEKAEKAYKEADKKASDELFANLSKLEAKIEDATKN